MRRWLTIAALLVATVFSQGQTTALRTILSGDNPILFSYSAGDSLAAATFSRASTATYRDVAGVLQTASTGVARDSHYALDPVSGLYKRTLLLEGQRTNLSLRSEEADNATWTKQAATSITANNVVGPDGVSSADTVTATAGATAHGLYQGFTATAAPYTASVFAKAGTASWLGLGFGGNATVDGAFFNLSNGTIGTVAAGTTATISAWPNGWYRCAVTKTLTAVLWYIESEPHTADNQVINWNAAGTETIAMVGHQLELGTSPSSYIPTTTATVTRAADSLSFPFTHPPQEMTVFARWIEGGSILTAGTGVLELGSLAGGEPRLLIYSNGSYNGYHSAIPVAGFTPQMGESVETRLVMRANGNLFITGSRNGAAETVSADTAGPAIEPAWYSNNLNVNAFAGAKGFNAFRDIIIVKGIRDLAWFRSRIAP